MRDSLIQAFGRYTRPQVRKFTSVPARSSVVFPLDATRGRRPFSVFIRRQIRADTWHLLTCRASHCTYVCRRVHLRCRDLDLGGPAKDSLPLHDVGSHSLLLRPDHQPCVTSPHFPFRSRPETGADSQFRTCDLSDPRSGWSPSRLGYQAHPHGLSILTNCCSQYGVKYFGLFLIAMGA